MYSRLTTVLVLRNVIFDFATKFRAENETIASPKEFKITDDIYQQFVDFALKQDFEYTTESSDLMDKLKEAAKDENFLEDAKAEYEALLEKLKPSKERDLQKFKDEIIEVLEDEIVGRYYYQKGRISHSLDKDPFVLEAIKILNDQTRYKDILKIQD